MPVELCGGDDLVAVSGEGALTAVGERAATRLRARAGPLHLLPSPPQLLFLRQPGAGARACMLSGELRAAGALCDILSFIGHVGWRGELIVEEAESARSLYFDRGDVVGAQSSLVRERLGEVLYAHGVLTREQVTQCSDATAAGAVLFGEAAVQRGFMTREKLFDLMARQTEEIFYGCVCANAAMFYFLEGHDETQLSVRQNLGVTSLMQEAIQRMHETRYFRARIPSPEHVPALVPGWSPPASDPLGLYAAIDGTRSVQDLCRVVSAGEFEVTRALFQLVQSGRVAVKARRLSPTEAVSVFNRAIIFILRELDAMDEGDAVRTELTAFAGRTDETHMLDGAGPADDGTFDARRIEQNAAREPVSARVEDEIAELLHRLASYALFLARPHMRPPTDARAGHKRLSERVTAMLEPIAPPGGRPPAGKGGR